MDTTKTITHVGLCAGYGGIELGLGRVLPTMRSVALCEIEAFACANLVAKMEAGLMEPAPIWTDLKSFPWESFRDRVDILTGGYPCQPFSAAGKRLGTEDPRHLWPYIASGIRILRPKLCFFENVEGHISLGLREVVGELEQMGYKVSWGVFSAREVGAPHQRKRVFIMAHCEDERCQLRSSERWTFQNRGEWSAVWNQPIGQGGASGEELAHRHGFRGEAGFPRHESWHEGATGISDNHSGQAWPSRPGEPQYAWEPPRVVNPKDRRQPRDETPSAEIGRGTTKPCLPVGEGEAMGNAHGCRGEKPKHQQANLPTKPSGGNAETMGNALLTGSSPEWSSGGQQDRLGQPSNETMGNTSMLDGAGQTRGQWETQTGRTGATQHDRQTQPSLGGDPHGSADWMDYAELYTTCDNRTDELRLLGNGVVPATAERAFRTLLNDLT